MVIEISRNFHVCFLNDIFSLLKDNVADIFFFCMHILTLDVWATGVESFEETTKLVGHGSML